MRIIIEEIEGRSGNLSQTVADSSSAEAIDAGPPSASLLHQISAQVPQLSSDFDSSESEDEDAGPPPQELAKLLGR